MTRKLMLASAIATALTGHPALALELGALRTDSALNQPFVGEIDLGDIDPVEIDALRVSIASAESFEKAGIERYYYLTRLSFTPEVTADGRTLVRVSSQEPVREPYLDFLVEAVWPTGRLVKGYTVLLDPPAQTERRAPSVQTARAGTAVSSSDRRPPPATGAPGTYIPAPGEGFPLYVGPVGGGDGLWSLARRHTPAGATDAQTAMALYRCNQAAFVRGDINRLIAGRTLVIPSRAELFALDAQEARRELQAALKGRPTQRAPLTDVAPEALSRLRLVGSAPSAAAPTAPTPQPGTDGTGAQSPDALMAIEISETARQEATELRNRIQELETQLADIQALLQIRNAELARAQAVESQSPEMAAEPDVVETPLETEPRVVLEPVETPEPSSPAADSPVPVGSKAIEPSDTSAPAETTSPIEAEPSDAPAPGETTSPIQAESSAPESPAEAESMPSDPTTGLVPIPTPMPVTPETAATGEAPDAAMTAAPQPTAAAEPAVSPAPAVAPQEPAPEIEPTSTWHSLLLPLAGLAGVTALGILLFSVMTARRRRQEQAGSGDESDSDLVLDRPYGPASKVDSGPVSPTTEPSDTLSLTKTSPKGAEPTRQTNIPSAAPKVSEPNDVPSEPILSGLTDFDIETDEADVISEADIYIAYGRHREACDLLNKETKRYPQRLDIKYKLAETLAAMGDVEALRRQLDEIRAQGGDTKEPAHWEQMQHLLKGVTANTPSTPPSAPSLNPAFAAAATAAGAAGPAGAASGASESVTVPVLESATEFDLESEDDLLLDLGDSDPFDSQPQVPAVEEIAQAIKEDIDSILPLPEKPEGLDLDLMLDGPGVEPAARTPQVAPVLLDEPSDKSEESRVTPDSGLSAEQESAPTDLLSSQWQIDSGIWDETATKLDLARAYVEMDDKDAAREILEEVIAEGREEQRSEARAMLERLGG